MGNPLKKAEIYNGEEPVMVAREHIDAAAQILKQQTPELGRIGWMLEDMLMYLDQAEEESIAPSSDLSLAEAEQMLEAAKVNKSS